MLDLETFAAGTVGVVRLLREYGYDSPTVVATAEGVPVIAADRSTTVALAPLAGGVSEWVVTFAHPSVANGPRIVRAGGSSWFHLFNAVENIACASAPVSYSACETGRLLVRSRRYFLPEDVRDGNIAYRRESLQVWPDLGPRETVDCMRLWGVSFGDGARTASDPNGSTVVDYRTGERVETSAFLLGYSPLASRVIVSRVG